MNAMDTEREDTAGRIPSGRIPLVIVSVLVVVVAVAAVLYLTRGGQEQQSARLTALRSLIAASGVDQADVQQVNGQTLVLSAPAGSRSLPVVTGTRIEALLPAKPDAIAVGDFLTVGGVPNLINSYAIKLVVLIPATEAGPFSAATAHSKGGFTGWEAYGDPMQTPELSGKVTSIDQGAVRIATDAGDVTLRLDGTTPLRRLTAGGVELVHGGDRVAIGAGAPGAILVLPGNR